MTAFRTQTAKRLVRGAVIGLVLSFAAADVSRAQSAFAHLAGAWAGSGSIELSTAREPIRCRASYDVLEDRHNLQLNIRCASDSYNFDLRASATYSGGAISGSWSESTRNAAGTISGNAEGDRIQVLATSSLFTAELTLVTRGNRQSVLIKSQDKESSVKGAIITLQRSS